MLLKKIAGNLVGSSFNQVITFLITIILARHLGPSDFGTVAVLLSLIGWSEHLIDCGLTQGLILKPEINDEDKNTFFWFTMTLSIFFSLVFFLSSENIAVCYKINQSIILIKSFALLFLFMPLNMLQRVLLIKDLRVKDLNKITIISSSIAGISALIFVFNGFGIWTLVIRQFLLYILTFLVGLRTVKFIPAFRFSKISFFQILRSSGFIFFTQLLGATYNQLDKMYLGLFIPVLQIGYYDRGSAVSNILRNTLSSAFGTVSMPFFSKFRENKAIVKNEFLEIIKITSYVILPLSTILFLEAETVINILLGHKWSGSAIYLKILALTVYFVPMSFIFTGLINSMGEAKYPFFFRLLKISLFLIITPLVYMYFDVWLVVICILLISVIEYILLLILSLIKLRVKFIDFMSKLMPSLISLLILIITHHFIKKIIPVFMDIKILPSVSAVLISLISFVLFILIIDRPLTKKIYVYIKVKKNV